MYPDFAGYTGLGFWAVIDGFFVNIYYRRAGGE
jgi:hypothetical protein